MKWRPEHITIRAVTLALMLLGVLFLARPASAHERVEAGPYVIIVGWEKEPVIVGDRNALVFEFTENGEPVENIENDIDLTVQYAGRTFRGNLNPAGQPGWYRTEILPTVRGQYEVLLVGQIGDTALNEVVEPEEVLPAANLEFPERSLEPQELQESLDDLQAQLQTARLLAIVGIAVGVIGLVVAIMSLVSGRRSGR